MPSVWGVSAVAILDSSVNCVCVWSTKKLTMPAYCVAANCNNSQTTPGITMHELPGNRPAVRRKWIKFIQFKRADFLAALWVRFRKPHGIPRGVCFEADTMFRYPAWQTQTDTAVFLWVSWAKYQFRLRMMMSWCLMSSDVIWHIRDKLWPMPKHGSIKATYVRCMRI